MFNKKTVIAASILAFSQTATAADLFNVDLAVSGLGSTSFGFNNAEDALNSVDFDEIRQKFSGYNETQGVSANVNYRGVPINLTYPNGGTTLTLDIPAIGLTGANAKVFTGTTRDQSSEALVDYLKKEGANILTDLSKALAKSSPVDPVAGNPNSLMSRTVAGDYEQAVTNQASKIATPQQGQSVNNLIGVGLRYGSFKQDSLKSNVVTLPLSYTIRNDLDPRRQLIFSMPVAQSDAEGAKAYSVGLGVAYRYPINDSWTLTPAVNYGLTASIDMFSVAQLASASLTSLYVINRDNFDIAIGNMLGYAKTLKFNHDDVSYDPGIHNTVLRNGVMFSQPLSAFGKKMAIEYSAIDTRFSGTDLYMDSYQEFGVTIGTNKSASSSRSFMRAGLTYLHSNKAKGPTINFGYWF